MISSEAATRTSSMRYMRSVLGDTPAIVRRDQEAVRLGFEASSSRGQRVMKIERASIRSRRLEVVGSCFPSEMRKRRVTSQKSTLFISEVFHVCVSPNKAPEPTPGPVTSRAVWVSEMALSRKARLAPGPVVAHL